jgi:hypothetical protein
MGEIKKRGRVNSPHGRLGEREPPEQKKKKIFFLFAGPLPFSG